jgi:hypothetical protein
MRRNALIVQAVRWCSGKLEPLFLLFPIAAWANFRLSHQSAPHGHEQVIVILLIAGACVGIFAVEVSWALKPWRAWRRRKLATETVLSRILYDGGQIRIQGVTWEGLFDIWDVDRSLSILDIEAAALFTFLGKDAQLVLLLRNGQLLVGYAALCADAFAPHLLEGLGEHVSVRRKRSFIRLNSPTKQLIAACAAGTPLALLAIMGFLS